MDRQTDDHGIEPKANILGSSYFAVILVIPKIIKHVFGSIFKANLNEIDV